MKVIPVEEKIQRIQQIFIRVQENFPLHYSLSGLAAALNAYDEEFISVAYEAASFCIGLKDLEGENQLSNWQKYLNEIGGAHAVQIYVGLGWAFAQRQVSVGALPPQTSADMRCRVLDGYGYYEGVFRSRKSILSQQKFETENEPDAQAYDQGLGRSLWYTTKADVGKVKATFGKFAPERQKHLWRGLGIAVAYAGGCNAKMLKEIISAAGTYRYDFAEGTKRALQSRSVSGSYSADTQLAFTLANE